VQSRLDAATQGAQQNLQEADKAANQ